MIEEDVLGSPIDDPLMRYRQRVLDELEKVSLAGMPCSRNASGQPIPLTVPLLGLSFHLQALPARGLAETLTDTEESSLNAPFLDTIATLNRFGESFYRRGKVYRELERPKPVDPLAALHNAPRFVALGAAGSGKSVMLRYLAYQAALEPAGPVPIRVALQHYALQLTIAGNMALRDFAIQQAAAHDTAIQTTLQHADRILWLLDDFDVLHLLKDKVVQQIRELPGDVVLTARPRDYHPFGLEEFAHFEMLPLTRNSIEEAFATCIVALTDQRQQNWTWAEGRTDWLRCFLEAHGCPPMLTMPLLFSFLAALDVDRRFEALASEWGWWYQCGLETLLDQWWQTPPSFGGDRMGFLPAAVSPECARQLTLQSLYFLGWYLHTTFERQEHQLCHTANLVSLLSHYFRKIQPDCAAASNLFAEVVLLFWQETGILRQYVIGHQGYLFFRHHALREYAAAQYLSEKWQTSPALTWKFLTPRLHHDLWQEPLVLFVQGLSDAALDGFVQRLLQGPSAYERQLYRDLRLTARLLGERTDLAAALRHTVLQQLCSLETEKTGKQRRLMRAIYLSGLLVIPGLFAVTHIFQELWELFAAIGIWSVIWQFAFERPISTVLQGILALPHRLWRTLPDRMPIMHLLEHLKAPEAIPWLQDALSDSRFEVRQMAVEALAQTGQAEIVPSLVAMLQDPHETVRQTAALTLQRMGHIPALLQAIKEERPEVREAAAHALETYSQPDGLPALAAALSDPNIYVRRTAVYTLKQIGGEAVIQSLLQALEDSDRDVRLTAVKALGQIGGDETLYTRLQVTAKLAQILDDSDPQIRWSAAYGLGQIHDPEILPILLQALRKNHNYVHRAIADAVQQTVQQNSLSIIVKGLKDQYADVRRTVAEILGQWGDAQSVPALLEALQDDALAVRRDAAGALWQIGDLAAVPALIAGLDDAAWQVRWACTEALGRLGDLQATPHLQRMLRDSHVYVCRVATEALGNLRNAATVPDLIQMLQSPHAVVHRSAQTALQQIGRAEAVPYLLEALKDEHDYIRKDAENALKELEDARAIPYLIQTLTDSEAFVRKAAVEALGRLGAPEVSAPVRALWHDSDSAVRSMVAEVLGTLGDAAATASLIDLLHDEDKGVRRTAAKALGKTGQRAATEALIALFQDADINVRRAALEAVGRIGDPSAVPALLAALDDTSWWVRWGAAYALGRIGGPEARNGLIEALRDQNENVRRAAAEALAQVGGDDAIKALMKALGDSDWPVRWAVVSALGQLGDAAVVPRLVELIDENEKVRWAIVEALGKIGHAQAAPFLIQGLFDSSWDVRQAAARALLQISDANMVPYLLQAMKKNNEYVRRITASALRQIHDPQVMPHLIGALQDEQASIRRIAAEQLLQLRNPQTVPRLIPLLRHHNKNIRQQAVLLLAQFAPLIEDRALLKRAASGLWWRLTDVEEIAKAAFDALEQVANRLAIINLLTASHEPFIVFSSHKTRLL